MRMLVNLPVLAALLLLAGATAAQAATAGGTCTCENGGTVKTSSDLPNRCECECPASFYPPTCAFTATEEVILLSMWGNTSAVPYASGGVKVRNLYDAFGLSQTTSPNLIRLSRRVNELEPNKTVIVLLLRVQGQQVDQLVRDFEVKGRTNSKYSDMALLRLEYYVQPVTSPSDLSKSPRIGGDVPWAAVSWIVGAIILLIAYPIMECIFGACCRGSTFCAPDGSE